MLYSTAKSKSKLSLFRRSRVSREAMIVSSDKQNSSATLWTRLRSWAWTSSLTRFPTEKSADKPVYGLGIWIFVNITSTVAIVSVLNRTWMLPITKRRKVFVNKSIFTKQNFGNCQIGFAAYHFFITGLTLWTTSRPCFGYFSAKRLPTYHTFHLAVLMSLQVILQNLSLAFSSVIFHQLVRLLLTPLTAMLNFYLYAIAVPKASIAPLMIMCVGVGMVSWYDTLPEADTAGVTSSRGAAFAFTGVFASALYTIFVGRYHRRFEVSSAQLLLNQAPVSAVLLFSACIFFEDWPDVSDNSSPLFGSILIVSCLMFSRLNLY